MDQEQTHQADYFDVTRPLKPVPLDLAPDTFLQLSELLALPQESSIGTVKHRNWTAGAEGSTLRPALGIETSDDDVLSMPGR